MSITFGSTSPLWVSSGFWAIWAWDDSVAQPISRPNRALRSSWERGMDLNMAGLLY